MLRIDNEYVGISYENRKGQKNRTEKEQTDYVNVKM